MAKKVLVLHQFNAKRDDVIEPVQVFQNRSPPHHDCVCNALVILLHCQHMFGQVQWPQRFQPNTKYKYRHASR